MKFTQRKKRDANIDDSKLFLNVVHSEQIAKPTASKSELGSEGSKWSVPYALGPLRMEQNKSGNNLVSTFDCCFHPSSLRYGHSRKDFLDLIIGIAKDAVIGAFENSGDEMEILSGYKILRGVSYKSGTPKALMVSANTHSEQRDAGTGSSGLAGDKAGSKATPEQDTAIMQTPTLAEVASETKPLVPHYKIVEQGYFDIAEHTIKATTTTTTPRRPRKLIIHVYLDEATSAAQVNLEVCEKELKISPDSKCKYKLELVLPYPVNPQKGNASFVAQEKTLIVTLPVSVT